MNKKNSNEQIKVELFYIFGYFFCFYKFNVSKNDKKLQFFAITKGNIVNNYNNIAKWHCSFHMLYIITHLQNVYLVFFCDETTESFI